MRHLFVPKIVTVFREGYSRELFFGDLSAGIITGIVALPLAIAFAIASGVAPEQGLYTAIIAGVIISLLSGSKVQIGGPTGAFIVVVFSIVQKHGISGLATATVMAGFILILMGLFRLGDFIKFIPYPVTVGFTAGIAVIIAVTQIKDFFGMSISELPSDFYGKIIAYGRHLSSINLASFAIGICTVAIIYLWPRITKRLPGSLMAIILCTSAVCLLKIPVETIGSRFGEISSQLPEFKMPGMSVATLKELFPSAITIAMLGAIESLLSAVVADGMTGGRHRSNMELVGQGVANIVSPFFGGIPATGAIARTATNIRNGGRTPVAGIIHALVLLLLLLCLGKLAALIPMAVLAGILIVVAINMSEYHLFLKMFTAPKSDLMVMVSTFLLTVLVDLTVAIQTGMILAAFLFMKRMSQVSGTEVLQSGQGDFDDGCEDLFSISHFTIPHNVEVFEINGPFFFGAARKFQDALNRGDRMPKVLILRMRNVSAMDATGMFALEEMVKRTVGHDSSVIISGIHSQPFRTIRKAGLEDLIGVNHFHKNIAEALQHAEELVLIP